MIYDLLGAFFHRKYPCTFSRTIYTGADNNLSNVKCTPLCGMSVRYRSCVKLLRVLLQCLDEKSSTNFHFICSGDNLLGYDTRIKIYSLRVHFLKGIMKRYFCLGSKMSCSRCLGCESAAR